jgi:hypothetical protein
MMDFDVLGMPGVLVVLVTTLEQRVFSMKACVLCTCFEDATIAWDCFLHIRSSWFWCYQ